MTQNTINQNIDSPRDNPLQTDKSTKKPKTSQSAVRLWRIKLIPVTFAVTVFLLIFTLTITTIRKNSINKTKPLVPTPKPLNPSPTITNILIHQNQIPKEWQQEFQQIDKLIKSEKEFLPPPIDTTIGL